MVAENNTQDIPSLNRLLYRTFLGSMIMFALISLWEYFADPDPIDPGTFLFYGLVLVMCLGVQWAMYKLKLETLLRNYPAVTSNILGITVFYIFLFIKQPVILFGVALFILSALSWHWITTYRD
ncbi:hypothetical protein [Polluticoccus soli]|uniref:hypothetical protein n=1 Tax=Polluticoccus soli TaxID=3034150 RepID=UPI0023E31CFF|nr:hypothetical protein [Flavipsychrobacter sp. JY13-12]